MEFFELTLDLGKVLLAIGACLYGFYLTRFFHGGIMSRPLQTLVLAAGTFALAETFHVVGVLVGSSVYVDVHSTLELITAVFMILGFYQLYTAWSKLKGRKEGGRSLRRTEFRRKP